MVMWLIMRGALGDPRSRSCTASTMFPRSNTAVGHLVLRPTPDTHHRRAADMRIALAGAGAFGIKHLDAPDRDRRRDRHRRGEPPTRAGRRRSRGKYGAPPRLDRARRGRSPATTSTPSSCARRPSCTRRSRSRRCAPGKHVQVEIPLADCWADALEVAARAAGDRPRLRWSATPAGSTRRTSGCTAASLAGELAIQQMDVQTYFFRRTNMNAARTAPQLDRPPALAPRRAHGRPVPVPDRRAGHRSPTRCRVRSTPSWASRWTCPSSCGRRAGKICTLSLSFNNDGPLGTFFRYICDNGTYIARYDDLVTGSEEPIDVSQVDVSTNGIELQDREFVAAISEGREPNSSVAVGARLLPGARRARAPAR